MNKELVCPFCGKWLDAVVKNQNDWIYSCGNPSCEFFDDCDNYEKKHYLATPEFWREFMRTRKALDVAVDALRELRPAEKKSCYLVPTVFTTQRIIDEALDKITALEQKDK